MHFKIKLSKYYLMMAILVRERMDTRIHYQIWLRGEKIDTGRRFSLNISRFNNICCNPNWEVMAPILEPSKFVVSPVCQLLRLYIETTNGYNWKRISCWNSINSWLKVVAEQKNLYQETKLLMLSPIFITNVTYFLKYWILIYFKGRKFQ